VNIIRTFAGGGILLFVKIILFLDCQYSK